MRFLIDMNLSPGWVDYLTRAGHHAEHWSAIGPGDAPDDELLAYAAQHRMVILTQDLDFGTLLARDGLTTSVIQFRTQAVLPDDLGPALLAAIDAARPCHPGAAMPTKLAAHRHGVPLALGTRHRTRRHPTGPQLDHSREMALGSGPRAHLVVVGVG